MISDSVSDGLSGVSASLSTSNSFNFPSPPPLQARSRARLSPVTEGKIAGTSSASSYPDTRPSEPGFDMITVLHSRTSEHAHASAGAAGVQQPTTTRSSKQQRRHGTSGSAAHTSPAGAAEEDLFARQKVPPIRAVKSALSSMMAASNTTNPFSDLYSAISGRGVSPAGGSMVVTVFFPFAREPAGEPMRLSVRKDASVEEVLGFGLWSYWEAGWLPRLDDEDLNVNAGEDKLGTVGWVLKIAEDDGEVDEDFPRKSSFWLFPFHEGIHAVTHPFPSPEQRVENSEIQFRGIRRAGG